MHRTVRMLSILIDLQGGATTIGALAAKYECSRKTIQRDIAALTNLNLPITSSAGVNGGISIDPAWTLAPMNLSIDEIETVALALENATHLPAAEQTLAKIRNAAKPAYFDSVASRRQRPQSQLSVSDPMPAGVAQLRNVMNRDMWCRIDYAAGSNPGWRVVFPYELRVQEGRWYLHAIDERSREHRIFRVDRMQDVQPTLAPANAAGIIAAAADQPDYQSPEYPEVDVILTDAGIRFCRDHSHFHRAIVDHRLRFRCPPREYRYVARELMRMGTDCRVLAPSALITTLRNLAMEIVSHVDSNKDITVS